MFGTQDSIFDGIGALTYLVYYKRPSIAFFFVNLLARFRA